LNDWRWDDFRREIQLFGGIFKYWSRAKNFQPWWTITA